ncbi:MAG: iron-containing alcohol dehydrogenase [Acidobacteriota bacterium]
MKEAIHHGLMGILKLLAKLLPIPRPIAFTGEGAARKLCAAIAQMGSRHVLLVTDATLVGLGLHEETVAALEEGGVEVTIFDGVEPDPTDVQVRAGLTCLHDAGCDAVLAFGGGSPIDAAKVISVLATHPVPIRKLVGFLKIKRPGLPFFAIPTTAGTGSEVTVAAVISDPETHLKTPVIDPKLVPQMTALDPTLMAGMPPAVTADTGLDALTHALEAYLSRNAMPETDGFARAAVRLIFAHLPRAWADGRDLVAREAMAMASFYAGLAFTKASVGYMHAIAHSFGAHYGTPHGRANAIVMPHILEFSKGPAAGRLAELARVLDLGSTEQTEDELAEQFLVEVRALLTGLEIPDHLDDLRRTDIPQIASEALKEGHYNYPVPRYMHRQQCEQILADMLPTGA